MTQQTWITRKQIAGHRLFETGIVSAHALSISTGGATVVPIGKCNCRPKHTYCQNDVRRRKLIVRY